MFRGKLSLTSGVRVVWPAISLIRFHVQGFHSSIFLRLDSLVLHLHSLFIFKILLDNLLLIYILHIGFQRSDELHCLYLLSYESRGDGSWQNSSPNSVQVRRHVLE